MAITVIIGVVFRVVRGRYVLGEPHCAKLPVWRWRGVFHVRNWADPTADGATKLDDGKVVTDKLLVDVARICDDLRTKVLLTVSSDDDMIGCGGITFIVGLFVRRGMTVDIVGCCEN